ncbi:ABC transporter substrate-binding protein [Bdellovibrionota bacterium FG-2]
MRRDAQKGLVPELAESYSVIRPDQEIEFKLKNGVRDSDGETLSPQYVKRSLEEQLARSLALGSDVRGYRFLVGFEGCSAKKCSIAGIQVKEPGSLRLVFAQPYPNVLDLLESTFFVHRTKKTNGHELPVSCGAYRISRVTDKSMLLEPSTSQLASGPRVKGSPSTFEIYVMKPNDAYQAFCRGEIGDLLFYMPTREDLLKAGCKPGSYQYKEVDSAGYWLVSMGPRPQSKRQPQVGKLISSFDAKQFRADWALESPAQFSILPQEFGIDVSLDPPVRGTELSPAGGSSKKPLGFRYICGMPNAKKLQSALKNWFAKAGVSATIIETPFTAFISDLVAGGSDGYVYAEIANSDAPLDFLSSFYQAALRNLNPKAAKRLSMAWENYSRARSKDSLRALEATLSSTGLYFPLFRLRRPLVMSKRFTLEHYRDFGLFTVRVSSFRVNSENK